MEQDAQTARYTSSDIAAILDSSTFLLDDGRYRVISLVAAPAASWWGRDTRWCTTDPAWFQAYHQHGELIFMEDRRTAMRWQFQFWRCELRNWRNRRADPLLFANRHPAIIEILRSRIERDFRARFFFGFVRDGEQVDHSLNLSGVPIQSLPTGLRIRDDLDVSGTGIRTLPQGLRVGGHLYVSARPLPLMPSDVKLRGRRYIRNTCLLHLCDTIG